MLTSDIYRLNILLLCLFTCFKCFNIDKFIVPFNQHNKHLNYKVLFSFDYHFIDALNKFIGIFFL